MDYVITLSLCFRLDSGRSDDSILESPHSFSDH